MNESPAVVTTIEEVRAAVRSARARGLSIGLVPTMGALHEGHVRLIEAGRAEADFVVVSVFVNPTQFGPGEDYSRYPRALDADVVFSGRGGASVVFAPTAETIYPSGNLATFVEVPGLSDLLEGASRPGHFRGVATVVLKLFQIVGPDLAHFGRKDYQQLQVIRRMVADLNVPVVVRDVATVREPDGLAMSSRNRYLDADDRRAAVILSRSLQFAADAVLDGERIGDRIRQILRASLESEPRAALDYAEVVDASSLAALDRIEPDRPAVALVAARVGPARLIDNRDLPTGPRTPR